MKMVACDILTVGVTFQDIELFTEEPLMRARWIFSKTVLHR